MDKTKDGALSLTQKQGDALYVVGAPLVWIAGAASGFMDGIGTVDSALSFLDKWSSFVTQATAQTTPLLEAEEDVSVWLDSAISNMRTMELLPANWDSYGALPVRKEAVLAATKLLRQITTSVTPEPNIVPLTGGGVQIEWHTAGGDLEIEVMPSGQVVFSFDSVIKPHLELLTNLVAKI